jgi:lysine 2,3-aminomutase
MSSSEGRIFPEKLSPFLRKKLEWLREEFGPAHPRYLGLARQYVKSGCEDASTPEVNRRHYEAAVSVEHPFPVKGIERLYRRTAVIELTMSCAAYCRFCLRKNYALHTLTESEILHAAKYCGGPGLRDEVNEVLVTGGDPFLVPQRLDFLIEALAHQAPNVKVVRVATRLPQQDPARVGDAILDVFRNKRGMRFEIATQTNHSVELFPEVRECFARILEVAPIVYSQNVLLKGVNDSVDELVSLYDTLRSVGLEPYYLFHAVPMIGTHHFRTSVEKGLALVRHITSCGMFSGKAKPLYAAMTDIGKISFYEDTILERDKKRNRILLQSRYRLEDRMRWNPTWTLPESAQVDADGYLSVWYMDGSDEESSHA